MPNGLPPATTLIEGRIFTLERDLGNVEKQFDALRRDAATKEDTDKLSGSLSSLAEQTAAAGKPNWQALSVLLGAIGIIGTLVYLPIVTSVAELKTSLAATITLQRYEGDMVRMREAFKYIDEQVQFIRKSFVRQEDYDKMHALLRERVADQNKLVEELVSRQRDGLARIHKLDEQARVAEKNIDILSQRNYKLATEPPPSMSTPPPRP